MGTYIEEVVILDADNNNCERFGVRRVWSVMIKKLLQKSSLIVSSCFNAC